MFIAALLTIAKTWKQPKYPLTGEWIKMIWYIIQALKKWNKAICSNMDGSKDYRTKWSKSDSKKQISYDINDTWYQNDTNNMYKIKIDS